MAQAVSLGAIARAKGGDLLASRATTPAQRKVLRSIADCRTDVLGGHRDRCDRCDYEHTFWNSCRDRHCPGCGAEARESWLQKRRDEVLDVPYFHVVFTIPESLNALALHAPEILYAILLRAAGQALLNRDRAANLAKARALIGSSRKLRSREPGPDPRLCPQCQQGTMRTLSRVDPQRPRTWFDSS